MACFLIGIADVDGAKNAYVYHVIDHLIRFIDGQGNCMAYGYDELSKLLSRTTPEAGGTNVGMTGWAM